MRNAEQFKIGFLTKLAEIGLTPGDIEVAVEKVANSLLGSLGKGGLALALGLPLAGGALVGMGARHASRADDLDVSELKTQELAAQYRQLAQEVRERTRRERERRTG